MDRYTDKDRDNRKKSPQDLLRDLECEIDKKRSDLELAEFSMQVKHDSVLCQTFQYHIPVGIFISVMLFVIFLSFRAWTSAVFNEFK